MGAKEINVFFLSLGLITLLLVMAVYFIILTLRRRQIMLAREKEHTEIQHRQQLLEARQEMQQSLMQNLGAELHDTIGQKLTLAYLQMENALRLENMQDLKAHAATQNSLILESLDELRSLSKILVSHDFSDFSFVHFLEKETARLQQSGLCKAVFIAPDYIPKPGDERVELTLARICQEFIQNSLKYSQCTEIRIEVKNTDHDLDIYCTDDGKGFTPDKLTGYDIKSGSGMRTISTRAAMIGATCEWLMQNGTQLKISLPLQKLPS